MWWKELRGSASIAGWGYEKELLLLWEAALFVSVDLHFSRIDLCCGNSSPSAMADTFR